MILEDPEFLDLLSVFWRKDRELAYEVSYYHWLFPLGHLRPSKPASVPVAPLLFSVPVALLPASVPTTTKSSPPVLRLSFLHLQPCSFS